MPIVRCTAGRNNSSNSFHNERRPASMLTTLLLETLSYRVPPVETISPSATRLAFASPVGDERLKGSLLSMAPILDIMDRLASAITVRYAQVPGATVVFNRVQVLKPVFNGDLVRVEGQVVHAGESAITVQCSGYRLDIDTNEYQLTHNATLTTSVNGRFRKPTNGLTKLGDDSQSEYIRHLEALAAQRRELESRLAIDQANVDTLDFITRPGIPRDGRKTRFVSIKSTELEFRQSISHESLNVIGAITGGVIMAWMEDAASWCARKFTKNHHVAATSMSHVLFRHPISESDIVTLRARVNHVREYQVEIEVDVLVSPLSSTTTITSHRGYFTLVNLNTSGNITDLKSIHTGLMVHEQDQDEMRYFLQAEKRRMIDQEEQEHLRRLAPLPISLAHGIGVVGQPVTSSRL